MEICPHCKEPVWKGGFFNLWTCGFVILVLIAAIAVIVIFLLLLPYILEL